MSLYKDFSILFIDEELYTHSLRSHVVKAFIKELEKIGCSTILATTTGDGKLLAARPEVSCILVSWETVKDKGDLDPILEEIKERNPNLSIFLYTEKKSLNQITANAFNHIAGFFYLYEDTYQFVAGRIKETLNRYIEDIMPPFFKALVKYTETCSYSWHTPGHSGGTAFLKSPAGRPFYNFFGENVFRADLSVSVPELGSLMEHTDVVGEAEKEAAEIFGADATYFVLNGTSSANKMVWHSAVTTGDYVLIDRNCHKSHMYTIIMTGAIPVYLKPTRNKYGILGPIPLKEIREQVDNFSKKAGKFRIAAITNSTYDGLCYKVPAITAALKDKVDILHLDEAWFAYAHFHPFYEGSYGMGVEPDEPGEQNDLTIFTTHSIHKLLAAFSQASMIHVKGGKSWKVEHDRFNEAFMMHTSTSPQYNMIASLDVAAKMMKGSSGKALLQDIIEEAFSFRYLFGKIKEGDDEWPFTLWQPDEVCNERAADKVDTGDWTSYLNVWARNPENWLLKPGDPEETWHGFEDMDENYILLDPVKVTIMTPGIDDGETEGIPAFIVSSYLHAKGIVVEKTEMYSFLILFTPGITKGKSGTLLAVLMQFKEDYKANTPLRKIFPGLEYGKNMEYDENTGLKDFCKTMHDTLMPDPPEKNAVELMNEPFETIPEMKMTPTEAYNNMVIGKAELVRIEELKDRISAVMIAPYPPGIPMIMPGEIFNDPVVDYLAFCKEFDMKFPGFETEIHGLIINKENNDYSIYCVTQETKKKVGGSVLKGRTK
ncbi:MAG: lysine decarboxylase [bacterium]|nr:lysine decarboxylase [bacterium]